MKVLSSVYTGGHFKDDNFHIIVNQGLKAQNGPFIPGGTSFLAPSTRLSPMSKTWVSKDSLITTGWQFLVIT